LFGDLAEGGEVEVDVPGKKDADISEKKLLLKVSARKGEPKALPASAE